uniref:Uncharacterized protein n=1 Tax=Panagrolaimus sp. JU765 TaxID=591449 RepID=A0AC34Q4Y2_9BILA
MSIINPTLVIKNAVKINVSETGLEMTSQEMPLMVFKHGKTRTYCMDIKNSQAEVVISELKYM